MSDDSSADTDGGGDDGGFFGWLWNAFLDLFSGDGADEGDSGTSGAIAGQSTQTNAGQPTNPTDAGTPQTVDVAPTNVTTTPAGADAGTYTTTSPSAGTTIPNREFDEDDRRLLDELTIIR
jgi:hypothetical protein